MRQHPSFRYYTPLEGGAVRCDLCRHRCRLKEGHVGICGVNKNEKGRLKNLVYGHPVALHVDPIEKKPLYHVLPGAEVLSFGTVGCNFKCPFCQNWDISQTSDINEAIEVSPEKMTALALHHHAQGIAYTYNEPTIFYPYAKDVGIRAKEAGLKNIFVSNGFETPEMIADMASWVDAANIDLKCWDASYYKKTLKGELEGVRDTLKRMVDAGIWVEVTTLIVPEDNDEEAQLEAMARFIADELGKEVPWHLSAFFPNYKMKDKNATAPEVLLKAKAIGEEAGLRYVYLGNIPVESSTFCPGCGTKVIERHGYGRIFNRLKEGKCPTCDRLIEGIWR